jgi:hypothetical protein
MDAEARLEQLVDQVVAKSGNLSREAAYSRVLKTAEGKATYAEYMDAEQVEQLKVGGYLPRGESTPERVVKAMTAEGAIEELARKHRARHPELTLEQAAAAVLRTPEGRDLQASYENARRGASAGQPASRMTSPSEARAAVRKTERVQLSKAAEKFVSDFEAWLREPGGRVEKTFEPDGRLKSIRYVPAGGEAEVAKAADVDPLDALLDELF